MSEKVTIYDIAREAEVSVATVSRILTGSAPVSPDTKRKVEVVLQKYNFRPNKLARNLSYQRSMMIGVILPDITNPYFSTVFAELQRDALAKDYSLLLFNAMNSFEQESEGLAYLSRHQVDGLIFMGGRVDEIALDDHYRDEIAEFAAKVPTVIVNGFGDLTFSREQVSMVHSDERSGIAQAVGYLTSLGHRHIGMLGGRTNITVTRNRRLAFREAMSTAGETVRDEWLIPGDFSIESGVRTMEQLIQLPELPTAVICINDLIALGALKAARHHRIDIPERLSVFGFDDVYLAEVSTPELTTVSHNYAELGRTIIETIIKRINNTTTGDAIVDMQLVVRSSCAAPRH